MSGSDPELLGSRETPPTIGGSAPGAPTAAFGAEVCDMGEPSTFPPQPKPSAPRTLAQPAQCDNFITAPRLAIRWPARRGYISGKASPLVVDDAMCALGNHACRRPRLEAKRLRNVRT